MVGRHNLDEVVVHQMVAGLAADMENDLVAEDHRMIAVEDIPDAAARRSPGEDIDSA